MKAGHYCFPCGKYLKYSLHMEGKTAQKKQQWPRTSTWFHVSVKCCQSSTFSVPICSNFGHGPSTPSCKLQLFTARIPMWAAHLPPASASRGPWPAVVAAPVRRHRSLRRSWRRWVPPSGRFQGADWMVGQCGAMWSIYRIYSHAIYHIYPPWWSMVCQAVSICFYPSGNAHLSLADPGSKF